MNLENECKLIQMQIYKRTKEFFKVFNEEEVKNELFKL